MVVGILHRRPGYSYRRRYALPTTAARLIQCSPLVTRRMWSAWHVAVVPPTRVFANGARPGVRDGSTGPTGLRFAGNRGGVEGEAACCEDRRQGLRCFPEQIASLPGAEVCG